MKLWMRIFTPLALILLACVGVAQAATVDVDLYTGSDSVSCSGSGVCTFLDLGTIADPTYASYYEYGVSGIAGGMDLPAYVQYTYTGSDELNDSSTISFWAIPDLTSPDEWKSSDDFTGDTGAFKLGTLTWNGTGWTSPDNVFDYDFTSTELSALGSSNFTIGIVTDCEWDGKVLLSYSTGTGAPPPVPEPTSLLLLGTGLGALGLARWRRKK